MRGKAKGRTMYLAVPAVDGRRARAVSRGWSMVCTTALVACSGASSTGAPDPAGAVAADDSVGTESEGISREHFRHVRRRHHRDDDDRDAGVGPDATSADASGAPDAEGDAASESSVGDGATVDATGADVSAAADGSVVDAGAGAEDAGMATDAAAGDTGAGMEVEGGADAQQQGCLVPGTYAVPMTGTQCNTNFLPNDLNPTQCVAVVSPFDNVQEIQFTFDQAVGWTAMPMGPRVPFLPAIQLVPTATGFTGTGSNGGGSNGAPQCGVAITIDCQAETVSVGDSCITATGNGCLGLAGSTQCDIEGKIRPSPGGGVFASFIQSGSAPLFDAGSGDSGAGGD